MLNQTENLPKGPNFSTVEDDQVNSILEISQTNQLHQQFNVSQSMIKPADVTQYSLMSHLQKSNSYQMGPPSSAPFNPFEELDKERLIQVAENRKKKKQELIDQNSKEFVLGKDNADPLSNDWSFKTCLDV